MDKKFLKLVALLSFASSSILVGVHELRTPLSLTSRLNPLSGYQHYRFKPLYKHRWNVDLWAGAYYRRADNGMGPKKLDKCSSSQFPVTWGSDCDCCPRSCGCCTDDCSSVCLPSSCGTFWGSCGSCCYDEDACNRKKIPLSELFFGKSDFRGEEVFADGILLNRPNGYPGLSFAMLRPRFDYNERGVVLGAHVEKQIEGSKWRWSWNVNIPIKSIEVEQNWACGLEKTEETLEDVVVNTTQVVDDSEVQQVSAYRLDFLSTLVDATGNAMVVYGDGSGATTIAGRNVTTSSAAIPMYAYRRDDGKLLPENFTVGPVDGAAVNLNAAGSNGADNTKLQFIVNANVNYKNGLGKERAAQGKLFMVPISDGAGELQPDAKIIQNTVNFILEGLDISGSGSAISFFGSRGICFCANEHIVGFGDLQTQSAIAYDFTERAYIEAAMGFKYPTGKKHKNPCRLFYMPTGNNGHFEFRFGLDGAWRSKKWFGIYADFSYSHVFEETEKRAAAFKGATVKNIGPCVEAKVKWGYFLGHLDMTVFHPDNQNLGFALGYEGYYKRYDKIRFCTCDQSYKVEDLLGERHALDSCVLESNTNILTHKIRGEVFHRWNYFHLYGGASRVVGGWNGMRETEAHIGCSINF